MQTQHPEQIQQSIRIQHFMQEQIFATIKEVVLAHIGTNMVLDPGTRLADDLAIDSLELVELGVKLEKLFGVKLENQQLRRCTTLQDLTNLIQSAKQGQ